LHNENNKKAVYLLCFYSLCRACRTDQHSRVSLKASRTYWRKR